MKCCRFGASSVYTSQPCTRSQCHFIQSHIGRVYACLAVTCYLHFWQNDKDLLRATAVTWGWNGYCNKSQHKKLTLEKKTLLPLLQEFKPATFQSRVQHSNHWAIPLPLGTQILIAVCVVHWLSTSFRPMHTRFKAFKAHAIFTGTDILLTYW